MYDKGTFAPVMDQMRNSLIGKPHLPHNHFMDAGALSISIVTHSPGEDGRRKQGERIRDFIWIMEKLVRINDQLDEQLHAGFFFYFLTTPAKFISNTVFIWPLLLFVYGLCFPTWLDYITFTEKNPIDPKNRAFACKFLMMNYGLGALIFVLPTLYFKFKPPV